MLTTEEIVPVIQSGQITDSNQTSAIIDITSRIPQGISIRQAFGRINRLLVPYIVLEGLNIGAGFFNSLIISRLGFEALAASGLIYSTGVFLNAPLQLALYPSGNLIGKMYGQGDIRNIGSIVQNGIIFSGIISIPSMIVSFFSGSILQSLGQPENIAFLINDYSHIAAFVIPISLLHNLATELLVGVNRPFPMFTTSALNISINTFFTYCLVEGRFGLPELGIKGWPTAGLIASTSTLAGLTLFLRLSSSYTPFELFHLRLKESSKYLRQLFSIGLLAGFQMAIETGINEAFTLIIGRRGVNDLIIRQVTFQYNLFFIFPITLIQQTVSILISQFFGEKNFLAVRKIGNIALIGSISVGTLGLIIYSITPSSLISPYIGDDLSIIDQAKIPFILNGITLVTLAGRQTLSGMLRGIDIATGER